MAVRSSTIRTRLTTRRTITVNGMPIHYETAGEGEPVVFVHGLSGSTKWWGRNISELATHYRLYLVDLPGFGAMRRHRKHFRLAEMVHWLAAWARELGLETFHLVGHSMGGYVCMAMAATHPEKVQRLVLVASIGIPFERSVPGLMLPATIALARTVPAFWPILLYDGMRAGPFTLWRASQQIVALDPQPVVSAVTTPTLLIWGEHDDLVPLAFGQLLRERLTNARLLILKKANHICMFDQPRTFNAGLLTFLQGQEIGE